MEYVKIVFKNKDILPLWLSLDKWQSIIEDDKNVVAYMLDTEQRWTGRVLNKSEVSFAEPDPEYTKKMNERRFWLYRNKKTMSIRKVFEGELPDRFEDWEKVDN